MYELLRTIKTRQMLLVEAPALVSSLVIAEVFYKFHSFTLECIAFLATWCLISAALTAASRAFGRRHRPAT